jgi:hypothetical protein
MSDTEAQEEGLSSLPETLVALNTGLPVQVQRGLWKAVARVFTTGSEVPAAWLEGRAEAIRTRYKVQQAELQSQQRARERVEAASAKAAAKLFEKPELAERALNYHAAQIMREQENRESVLQIAAEELTNTPPASEQTTEVDDDWLTVFFRHASTRSSEEFRTLFGRILAGEIKQPGTFSIGALQAVSRLNQKVADSFQSACNISSILARHTPQIFADPFGNAAQNSLGQFGLNYYNLAYLIEAGLIRPELSEWLDVPPDYYDQRIMFDHGGQFFHLSRGSIPGMPSYLRLTGPAFTQAGAELRNAVSMQISEDYIAKMASYLETSWNILLFRAVGNQQWQRVEPATA